MDNEICKINEDELTLPKASVDKLISDSCPKGMTSNREVKELIMECCVEFIHLITSGANEICAKENKKTITHQHIYKSLETLGYSEYLKECEVVYEDYLEVSKLKPSKTNKFKDSGLSMEELLAQQQALFENAKREFDNMGDDEEINNKE
ncbi:Negative cofactor 2 complex subunit beta [Astathelohania contejeani]|uniref:Negative cofactor 2 complex subunit beta n=1 Tax=Astathelohania contejeani TaxID=164912 RepID=A0ABQ7I0Y1_9MICR|nr:Negative cofactor 2 complex subunit beta [Thelohania contejeani]